MPRLTDLVEIHETAHTRFSEPEQERAARLAAMWSRAAEMFREPELFRQILDEIDEGVCFVGSGDRVLYWNRAAEEISGYPSPEITGRVLGGELLRESRRHGCEYCRHGCPARVTARGRSLRRSSHFLRHKQGHWLPVHMRTSPMFDGMGRLAGAVRLFREAAPALDCVERLAALREAALLDNLTGLGNRRFAEGCVEESFRRWQTLGQSFGILLADLDGLADVNWIHGQQAGDQALRTVAASLSCALRRFDAVARWGDSTFLAVVEGLNRTGLACLAGRIAELASWARIPHAGGEFAVTLSIGGASARPADTVYDLIRRACERLQQAKATGRGLVSLA